MSSLKKKLCGCFPRARPDYLSRGLRFPKKKKKKTRDGRPLDRCGPEVCGSLPLWSSLELPLPRCAASIPRCLVCSSLYFQDRRAIEQLRSKARGARKAKKMLLWFLGGVGWVAKKKEKKTGFLHTPRMDGPDGSRRAGARPGAPFETTFPENSLKVQKHGTG